MRKIDNEKHIATVVRKIYADAQAHDWEHLTHPEHTEWYARWLSQDVGKTLADWMSPEEARVWLKDGPMKEYARALAGEGPFAKYLDEYPRAPAKIVGQSLGPQWTVVPNSVGVKPLQCQAEVKGSPPIFVFWGPSRDFKHLLWAALNVGDRPSCIVVWDTVGNPLSKVDREHLLKIGQRCALELKFIRL